MEFVQEKELIWTSIVANSSMNRQRNLTGINSYEKDLYFDILAFIETKLSTNQKFSWIDLCCGEAKALFQAQEIFTNEDKISLEGIDLIDMFVDKNNKVKLQIGSLLDWKPSQKYDLITCVHGLHYIGNKLLIIEKVCKTIKEDGMFIANIDLDSIKNSDNQSLKKEILKYLKEEGLLYNSRQKILICEGNKSFEFDFQYLGADTKAGKNYTGQEAINSIYQVLS